MGWPGSGSWTKTGLYRARFQKWRARPEKMAERLFRKKLKAADLEALIMKRLAEHPHCGGIIQVYVKATGREPPEDTWMHIMVSRRRTPPELSWRATQCTMC